MTANMRYMAPEELAAILRDSERLAALSLSILDVRNESEYSEGHIRGSTNVPSTNWSNAAFVESIVETLTGGDTPKTVVMHCAYSQQRGPSCARILQGHLDRLSSSEVTQTQSQLPTIYVLRGGFVAFDEEFEGNSDLINIPESTAAGSSVQQQNSFLWSFLNGS